MQIRHGRKRGHATAIQVFAELSYQFTGEMFLAVAETIQFQGKIISKSIAEFLERYRHGRMIAKMPMSTFVQNIFGVSVGVLYGFKI